MNETYIQKLGRYGQSVWLDHINRAIINSGRLQTLLNMGIQGIASSTVNYQKALSNRQDYDQSIRQLYESGLSTEDVYETLIVKDIQTAADVMLPVYRRTNGSDGYVSLDINNEYAYSVKEMISEAQRLHRKVGRPNVLLKIPATDQGLAASQDLLDQGVPVQIKFIYTLQQYSRAAHVYLNAINHVLDRHSDISNIFSVAAVVVSRVDAKIDALLDDRMENARGADRMRLLLLKGRAGIANAQMIYRRYRNIFWHGRFLEVKQHNPRVQKLVWTSTASNNPEYSDIKYVSELVLPSTINSMPLHTFEAFVAHGCIDETVIENVTEAEQTLIDLARFDISVSDVGRQLLHDSVRRFQESRISTLQVIEKKLHDMVTAR